MSENLERQRARRKANGNAYTHKYERTKAGKLMRLYRNMKSRVEGVQWMKAHLYAGKSLLSKDEFYEWALGSNEFHRLYREWVESDYDRKLAPSVDRVDSALGYEIGNMQWVTHSENSRRGAVAKRTHRLEREAANDARAYKDAEHKLTLARAA